MKTKSGLFLCSRGFTLVELLTAMAIIAILIGLLVPTITAIQKTAQKVKQKSQFHGIEVTLESFRTDFGDYPDSSYDPPDLTLTPPVDFGYCGAQKLAEAIIGWDGFGVHPRTDFMSDGRNDVDGDGTRDLIYDVVNGITGSGGVFTESADDNHKVREGPYLELESANAVDLSDLYDNPAWTLDSVPVPGNDLYAYVLVDMFGKVTHRRTHKRTGMPILYYKADVGGKDHWPTDVFIPGWSPQNVYDIRDNEQIYTTPPPFGSTPHPLRGNQAPFYDRTWNPNFPGDPAVPHPGRRPYRSESFILHSAGRDGLYGSGDDVYNFDSE